MEPNKIESIKGLNLKESSFKKYLKFYSELLPTTLPNPYLVAKSSYLQDELNLSGLDFSDKETLNFFSGNAYFESIIPYSSVYSGHQFGQWAGQLGDGRAIFIGNIQVENKEFEIQLKGAGLTPYSRMGDGRAVLRSSIREFLCSEAMYFLNIPTTRSLSIIGSDEPVYREKVETAAVISRIAPSFIRFGHFEHWYYKKDEEQLKYLADFVIANYFTHLIHEEDKYYLFLKEVIQKTAELIAKWQAVGFMHGVMNTDNMSILGLTIDYGPYGFMDGFNQNHICNHSDNGGRYSYKNQPYIGQWNCSALAQTFLPLVGDLKRLKELVQSYEPIYKNKWDELMHQKLGLENYYPEDQHLFQSLLSILQETQVDFTIFFRKLSTFSSEEEELNTSIRDLFLNRQAFDDWSIQYKKRLKKESFSDKERGLNMNQVNPKYILRNYLLQTAIEKAEQGDFSEVQKLLLIVSKPFDEQPENETYAGFPPDWSKEISVSCSS